MTYDVAIIGAGIVGAACAAALASAGLRVIVIDRSGVGSGTTAAGMGHIVVMDDSEAQFALTSYSQKLWDKLSGELPQLSEYEHCGTIWVAADDEELSEARRKQEFYTNHGLAAQLLDERTLRAAEPNLREGLAGGLLIESDSVVYQLTATQFLIDKAQRDGAEIRLGSTAAAITDEGVRQPGLAARTRDGSERDHVALRSHRGCAPAARDRDRRVRLAAPALIRPPRP